MKQENRVNEQIRVPKVFLIDHAGNRVGIVDNYTAKSLASDVGLDLVEINPTAKPPVCKIMNFGKYCYELEKKSKENKQIVIKTKEIQFHPNIQFHDYSYRLEQAKEFLEKGNKVKASIVFRGREVNYFEKGEEILKRFIDDLDGLCVIEQNNVFEGKVLSVILRKS